MKSRRFAARGRAGVSGVLLATVIAALSASAPAVVTTMPSDRSSSGENILMPVVTVSSQTPTSPSAEDIRKFRRPEPTPTRWFEAAVATGIVALAALAIALRRWIRHGRPFVMPPHEIALQYLHEARRLMDPDQAHAYCTEMARILRRYAEEQFLIRAPQLTDEAFLRELTAKRGAVSAEQRALLGEFLQHYDLAHLAGWRYCRPDLEATHDCAAQFIHQTARLPSNASDTSAGQNSGKPPDSQPPSGWHRARSRQTKPASQEQTYETTSIL